MHRDPGCTGEFSYAFQPIVDTRACEIVSYEALIRGPQNEPPGYVFERVPPDEHHRFDERGRAFAISLAARLGIDCELNLKALQTFEWVNCAEFPTAAEGRERGADAGRPPHTT